MILDHAAKKAPHKGKIRSLMVTVMVSITVCSFFFYFYINYHIRVYRPYYYAFLKLISALW